LHAGAADPSCGENAPQPCRKDQWPFPLRAGIIEMTRVAWNPSRDSPFDPGKQPPGGVPVPCLDEPPRKAAGVVDGARRPSITCSSWEPSCRWSPWRTIIQFASSGWSTRWRALSSPGRSC